MFARKRLLNSLKWNYMKNISNTPFSICPYAVIQSFLFWKSSFASSVQMQSDLILKRAYYTVNSLIFISGISSSVLNYSTLIVNAAIDFFMSKGFHKVCQNPFSSPQFNFFRYGHYEKSNTQLTESNKQHNIHNATFFFISNSTC